MRSGAPFVGDNVRVLKQTFRSTYVLPLFRSAYARALGFENDVVWVADDAAIVRKTRRKKKKKKKKKKETADGEMRDDEGENEGPAQLDEICSVEHVSVEVDGDGEGGTPDG